MIQFAINVYGRFSVNYFSRNVDNLLVGWRFGAHSLGFYKKAYDLFALSTNQLTAPLTNVAVSALSRFKPRSDQYRDLLLSALSVMAFIGMALAADLTLIGKDLIRLLLGPGWEQAGLIFTFFGPGIGVMIIYYIHGWIHLSIGRADRWFRWGLVEVAVTCLFFLVALPWGPVGIAIAWTASFWILTVPAFWYAGRPISLGVKPVLVAVWKYITASLLAGCVCAGVLRSLPFVGGLPGVSGALARIVIVSLLFGMLYLGMVIVLHQGYAPLHQLGALLREMLSLGRPSDAIPAVGAACHSRTPGALVSQGASLKPLVSILIPAFNAQEWIAETLRSALAQTWERKEIIVVNDGSTDQTLAIARQFESDCVRVVTQRNQGAAAARNKAFSLCRGDYVQWLDADDLLAPDKIAKQMKVMEQCRGNRTLLSSAWGKFLYRRSRAEFTPTALWGDLSPLEWLLRKMGENLFMPPTTWLVSRALTEAAGPWDTRLLSDDDGEYFCRVLLASDTVRFVPEARAYYRAFGYGGLSYIGRSDRKINAHWLSMKLHIDYLRSLEESERVRAACLAYMQTSLIYFYPRRPEIVEEMEQTAGRLGYQLACPHLSWKYSWMKVLFGWDLARRGQLLLLKLKWWLVSCWDKALFRLEKPRLSANVGARG
jgi:glycosyltransferase involved in cell wall biosynthesis